MQTSTALVQVRHQQRDAIGTARCEKTHLTELFAV